MNPASNLFLVGPMGAGKSTIGRALARHYALPFVDLDARIEERTGATIPMIFEHEGEAGFRRRESELLAACVHEGPLVLATGGGAVLAAANRERLRAHGYVVYLAVDVERQLVRLKRDTRRPLLASPDRRERLEALARERTPLYREIADLEFAPGDLNPKAAARRLAALLAARWHRVPPALVTP